mmetsp:Transcript_71811/g.142487  ORF Transcript_71811/g.142487 Transcript_71811/m.142487 type:complete len:241 (-) Transcript_71811:80-802(-)
MAHEGTLLFADNEHYGLVDSLPYIDTQLGTTEVAQQVKALIDEEMRHFEARDYLSKLALPEKPFFQSGIWHEEMARVEEGRPLTGINTDRYKVEQPVGPSAEDHVAWRKAAENVQMQLEYNRLRLANLEMLERWGSRAWVAHSVLLKGSERVLANEVVALRSSREEINKKRKLDQVTCGNELRKLGRELEQYQQDNQETGRAVQRLDVEVKRLVVAAHERGVDLGSLTAEVGHVTPEMNS